jgi:thiamine-phosphate pyrophosphorylase
VTRQLPSRRPLLYLITEGNLTDDNFNDQKELTLEKVTRALDNSVDLVQIREKSLSGRNLMELSKLCRQVCSTKAKLLINDRFDIALAAELDGVHLTEASLPAARVRELVGERLLIGCSRHTLEGVKDAEEQGADFAVLGPIFPMPGKDSALGLERLSEICAAVPEFPILGIGGINADNIAAVVDAGVAGIAAIRFLNDASSVANLDPR